MTMHNGFRLAGMTNGRPVLPVPDSHVPTFAGSYEVLVSLFSDDIVQSLTEAAGIGDGRNYHLAAGILEFLLSAGYATDGRRLDMVASTVGDASVVFPSEAEHITDMGRRIRSFRSHAIRLEGGIVPGGDVAPLILSREPVRHLTNTIVISAAEWRASNATPIVLVANDVPDRLILPLYVQIKRTAGEFGETPADATGRELQIGWTGYPYWSRITHVNLSRFGIGDSVLLSILYYYRVEVQTGKSLIFMPLWIPPATDTAEWEVTVDYILSPALEQPPEHIDVPALIARHSALGSAHHAPTPAASDVSLDDHAADVDAHHVPTVIPAIPDAIGLIEAHTRSANAHHTPPVLAVGGGVDVVATVATHAALPGAHHAVPDVAGLIATHAALGSAHHAPTVVPAIPDAAALIATHAALSGAHHDKTPAATNTALDDHAADATAHHTPPAAGGGFPTTRNVILASTTVSTAGGRKRLTEGMAPGNLYEVIINNTESRFMFLPVVPSTNIVEHRYTFSGLHSLPADDNTGVATLHIQVSGNGSDSDNPWMLVEDAVNRSSVTVIMNRLS